MSAGLAETTIETTIIRHHPPRGGSEPRHEATGRGGGFPDISTHPYLGLQPFGSDSLDR